MINFIRKGKSAEEHAKELNAKLAKGLQTGADRVKNSARSYVGVDTGRLKNSLKADVQVQNGRIVGSVGSDVEYAFHHSLQNPYLERALDENLQNIIRDIKGG